ncbi:TonB-dependent receptor plug [Emticicia oligotrophica DSM 17448]|uniref:TonB-dependent receptor plug n=1 Tax=Emticicia oligotrophica (strain DSM 17448 / CIP 109782 / MTCC 6937 / GPTSA100-15) TaxID=929562 RepID=A0ABN4AP77_EMTOG|nr:TonB-dependent receptor [Emticicia oligotrophica]AFK04192.1 TonB-dependent receptor plug [Emticicia oligotrophica DSM 17448]
MKKKNLLLSMLGLFLSLAVLAQSKRVTGKVSSSDDGSALPGVSVQVKGTTRGTQTNNDGNFAIDVTANETLIFSFIGMQTTEVPVGSKSVINVTLANDGVQLEQLVVVGYGTQNRKDVTSAVSTIKGDAIKSIPAQSFDQLLSGKAAGVNINIPNGLLNNPPVIRVRGFNSITSSSYPLIVVDGVIVFSQDAGAVGPGGIAQNPLSDINPNDIETIDILKDAAATAIYGSRAANGVLVITTKKGKAGKSTITYDSNYGWTKPFRLFNLLNASEYIMMKNEAEQNRATLAGQPYSPLYFENLDPNGKPYDTNWYDYVFQTGFQQNHNINISGATPKSSYYFSGGYTNQEGFLKKNTFERKNARLNISHNVTEKLIFGANVTYSSSNSFSPNSGSLQGTNFNTGGLGRVPLVTAPNVPAYLPDGSYNINSSGALANTPGNLLNKDRSGFYNPVVLLDLDKASAQNDRFLSNVYATYNFTKNLSFRTDYGIDNQTVDSRTFNNPIHGDGFAAKGIASNYLYKSMRWTWQNYLNYNQRFSDKHTVSATLGTEQQYTKRNMWSGSRQTVADPFFNTYEGNYTVNNNPPFNFLTENGFQSYFGRVTYDFSKRYYFTGSLRRDGLSALAAGKKFGNFYGLSAGWNLAEETFFKDALGDKVSTLKLRTSYGKVGNAGISDFASLSLYDFSNYGGSAPALFYSQAGNPDLKWETSTKLDIGLNYGFLKDRITGEITYYKNNIDGLILNSPLAPSMGVPGNSVAKNVGSMYNEGLEFSLSASVINNKNFRWNTSFNLATQKNKVTALAEGNADIFGVTQLETANITRVGYALGSLYVVETRGVNPATGQRIFVNGKGQEVQYSHAVATGKSRWTFLDGTTAPAITAAADSKIMGNTIPKVYGGWDNNFGYKKFDLSVSLIYAAGFYVYNGTKAGLHDQRFWNNASDILDRWTETNTGGSWPRVVYGDNISNGSSFPISNNVEKGDFIKCRNIALGYNLPTTVINKIKMTNARVFGQVTNAFMLTKYTGTDPETSSNGNSNLAPGIDRNSIPQARTFSFGLSLTF